MRGPALGVPRSRYWPPNCETRWHYLAVAPADPLRRCGRRHGRVLSSESVRPAFPGTYPDDCLDRHGPYLAVADPAGLGCFGDDADEVFHVMVVADDFEPHLRH